MTLHHQSGGSAKVGRVEETPLLSISLNRLGVTRHPDGCAPFHPLYLTPPHQGTAHCKGGGITAI